MNKVNGSYSSKKAETTRVKSRKKQAKKTVGITLPPYLIEETRKRNLNISRICEQALSSILEYLAHQNESETSKSLNSNSEFPKETKPRWLRPVERQSRKLLVAGSNPARGSKTSFFRLLCDFISKLTTSMPDQV